MGPDNRILLEKIPPRWQPHVVGQDPSTNLQKMVQTLNNVNFWTSRSMTRGQSQSDPMDLGLVFETGDHNDEDFYRTGYKPVAQEGCILYGNISGTKTLMMGWKQLIKNKNEYRAES